MKTLLKRLIKKFIKALIANKVYLCNVFGDDISANRLIVDAIECLSNIVQSLSDKKPVQMDLMQFLAV